MEQGPTEAQIIELAMRHNQPLPEPIANAPTMPLGLGFYYLVFQELCSERVDGPIPGSAIRRYCKDQNITGEAEDDIVFHVRNLDNVLRDYQKRKAEQGGDE